jgi:NAD(P)H-dependent FMN reductase
MSIPTIGIIIGSTREGRFGDKPANWIHGIARQRADLAFELVDLRDHPLPFFNEAARRWASQLAALDGFIFVTPEYNHGPTAVLKNAMDSAYVEFNRKPVAFVGYGSVGAARSIEQLRLLATSFQMVSLNASVNIGMAEFMGVAQAGKSFDDYPYLAQSAASLLDDLAWWARVLKPAREAKALVK